MSVQMVLVQIMCSVIVGIAFFVLASFVQLLYRACLGEGESLVATTAELVPEIILDNQMANILQSRDNTIELIQETDRRLMYLESESDAAMLADRIRWVRKLNDWAKYNLECLMHERAAYFAQFAIREVKLAERSIGCSV